MVSLLANTRAFQGLLKRLSSSAASDVTAMWDSTDTFTEVEELYPPLADRYTAAAGTLAAQWYYDLNPDIPFETRVADLPDAGQLRASVGWAYTQSDTVRALIGATERHMFGTARQTVVQNAVRENVRFARYASANACAWCQVLATNPARYRTEEAAVAGHDGCNCMAVPVREGTDWTPPAYVAEWEQQYADARDAVGGDLNDITNYLRRQN